MTRTTDCLILGSGIAGLTAAIRLAEQGRDVLVITAAKELYDTNSWRAQGGIIYQALAGNDAEQLVADVLEAGARINYLPAVKVVAYEGPELVKQLLIEKAKVPFDKERDGDFRLTREGAHSVDRILHRGDESGLAIEEHLLEYAKKTGRIQFLTRTTAVNLLMTSYHAADPEVRGAAARCVGSFVYDQATGETYPILARETVLATGGIGQIFLHNTNSKYSRGDGIALAYRAGARLANLEYVQFHPTTFYHPKAQRFLVSEALRGEGARIVNQAGHPFLRDRLPELDVPELGPRDKVARAIHEEMLETGAACVYLDISHKEAAWIKERFPFVYRSCLSHGVDITKQPIPVVPGAHYHCGGVWTDLDAKTSVNGLWAVGEVACTGLHGANRLASTSLLEGLVFGHRAALAIHKSIQDSSPFPEILPWKSESQKVEPSFLQQDWMTLKHTMWNYAGLMKTEERLARAHGILNELQRGIETFYRKTRLSDELIGLRHATLVSQLIVEACQRNRVSKGCYQREETAR